MMVGRCPLLAGCAIEVCTSSASDAGIAEFTRQYYGAGGSWETRFVKETHGGGEERAFIFKRSFASWGRGAW